MSTLGKLQARLAKLLQINEAAVTHIESLIAERDYFKNGMAELQDIIDKLEPERDALVAQVLALQSSYQNLCGAIDDMDNCEEGTPEMEAAIGGMFHAMRNGYSSVHATPSQCLREIQAEAVLRFAGSALAKHRTDIVQLANEYAERVKRGEQ